MLKIFGPLLFSYFLRYALLELNYIQHQLVSIQLMNPVRCKQPHTLILLSMEASFGRQKWLYKITYNTTFWMSRKLEKAARIQ